MSNFHFDLSLKLSQGEVHDFSGEVQNDLRGGAHPPQNPTVDITDISTPQIFKNSILRKLLYKEWTILNPS